MSLAELDSHEARVLGVLIEKELTTPDQYPLTLNALASGCNQKSNRNPLLTLSEADVLGAFERLRPKMLAGITHPSGGRVDRYHHTARETLGIEGGALAVLTELVLRGPQTPGELRSRASRMHPIESLQALDVELQTLMAKGYARRLADETRSRAVLYALQVGAGAPDSRAEPFAPREPAAPEGAVPSTSMAARVQALETDVQGLRRQLEGLAAKLGEPLED